MSDAPDDSARAAPLRPKMKLSEQAIWMGNFCKRFRMAHPDQKGAIALEIMTRLTQDDMLILETVWQTLAVMDAHGADKMVVEKIRHERHPRGGRR